MYFDWEENQEFLEALANKLWSAANLTGACPVKYIEDVERSEFNWGASKGFFALSSQQFRRYLYNDGEPHRRISHYLSGNFKGCELGFS